MRFGSIGELEDALRAESYLPERGLATSLFLAQTIEKPLLLEGEAGVGKTEAAKALARATGARLIRLQCYEGLDVGHAVYEWNYARQLLHIRAAQEGSVSDDELFGPQYGLSSYFYSRDTGRVRRVSEALEYGILGINTGVNSTEVAPFGGVKESGLGREGSKYGVEERLEIKYLCMGGV